MRFVLITMVGLMALLFSVETANAEFGNAEQKSICALQKPTQKATQKPAAPLQKPTQKDSAFTSMGSSSDELPEPPRP